MPRRTLLRLGSAGSTGGSGSAGAFGYHVISPSGGHAVIDIAILGTGTTCFCFRLVLNGTAVSVPAPIWTGGTIVAGLKIWLYVYQDSTGNRDKPAFDHAASGDFGDDVAAQEPDGTPSTMSVYQLTYHGTRWLLDVESIPTGLAIQ